MTITNSNLQPLLSLSPEMSADSAAGLTSAAAAISIEPQGGALNEGEFWSMLSQQLTDITAQNDTQVIENKELLAMFDEFEADLEMTADSAELPARWMQIMAAPLAQDAESETPGLISELIDTSGETDPIVSVASPAELKVVTAAATGNNLPQMRQLASAGLPPLAIEPELPVGAGRPDAAMADPMPDVEGMAMNARLAADTELKASDINIEKVIMKQGALEQQSWTAPRDAGLHNPIPLNPASTAAAQSQPLSGSPLPGALQTLQLAPQSAASEWGNALGERVSFLINHKLERAEIRIDPPHLGKLDIQIQLKDDSAVVVINTQHAQTRDLLDSASFRLREFLQEAGYSSVDVNVSHQQPSMSEQGFSGQGQNDYSSKAEADDPLTSDLSSDGQTIGMTMSVENGRIDYFA